ncbi:FixH family protein [Rheinheimera sp.]|uniref:FixH family protein n=1 Tax=Rheinheimera sp. TaxID=1869214 RepID=UPI00307E82A1
MMLSHDKPWYKQVWPWILLAFPLVSFIKAGHTIYVMQGANPDLVVDDYYKEGRAINMNLALYREAALRNLQASTLIAGNQVIVRFQENKTLGQHLNLEFFHNTIAAKDFAVTAERSGENLYVATLPSTLTGKWNLVVSDEHKDWKLRATAMLPAEKEIPLGY